ncbi:type IV pilus secretin PilQ [Marinobacterium sediminicola]
MDQKMLAVKSGDVDSLHFAEANGRMRIVANLNEVMGYDIRVEGNQLLLELGGDQVVASADQAQPKANRAEAAVRAETNAPAQSTGVDFHRLEGDRGRITIDLANPGAGLDIIEEGGNVVVNLTNANLDPSQQQRLDVQDFATPVNFIDTAVNGRNATILIKTTSAPYDYMAYQSGSQLVLDFKPLTVGEQKAKENLFPYNGEKIDLNFQNVEIRTVLQIIAEVAKMNLVVSDNVQGDITLRLKNVPWDQALDIVLKTKGLDKREAGNVLLVGTVQEIAEREAVELQSQQSEITVAPLVTDFIQIDYRKASDIKDRVVEAKLVSERGFVMADDETNTLMVRETASQIEEIRRTIEQFDIEVAQVMVEARLVTATMSDAKSLGVKWGVNHSSDNWVIGGRLAQVEDGVTEEITTSNMMDSTGLMIDMGPTTGIKSGLALGFISGDVLINAELSALETDGRVEVVSQPKVITTNGKAAVIKAGQEIPTRTIDGDGEVTVEWKEVVLKLDVVPQLIPGDKVQLDLIITEDSVGEVYDELGNRLINKQELRTSIVIADGETVVLGGVLRRQSNENFTKTPLLGDIPVIGNLFKSRSSSAEKRELLIFITPQMIRESLRR